MAVSCCSREGVQESAEELEVTEAWTEDAGDERSGVTGKVLVSAIESTSYCGVAIRAERS